MSLSTPSADETQLPLEAEDVFFSITDSRGVITHANDVFVRLSGYSADDLVGSPHNIIRHPDMPGGAFALLWDALDAGLPASAYVSNRAQDGERYDVFATLVPVGDGFLSIRLRPELDDFHAIVQGAYDEAREAELKAREDGRNAREAARVGAKKLGDALASLGYNGLDDLARRVLPRELLAHRSRVTPLPRLTDGPAAVLSLIEMARSIEADLHRLAASLNSLDELAEQVAQRSDTLVPTIERLQGMSTEVRQIGVLLPDVELDEDDRTEGPTVPRAKKAAVRIGKLLDEAVDGLRGASGQLDEVRESIRDLAMRVSLLVLDAVMIGRFGTEIVQSSSDVDRSEEIVLLHQALAEGRRRPGHERRGDPRTAGPHPRIPVRLRQRGRPGAQAAVELGGRPRGHRRGGRAGRLRGPDQGTRRVRRRQRPRRGRGARRPRERRGAAGHAHRPLRPRHGRGADRPDGCSGGGPVLSAG